MQINKFGNCTTGFGKMNNPKIVDSDNIYNFSDLLKTTTLKQTDYAKFLKNVKKVILFIWILLMFHVILNSAQ